MKICVYLLAFFVAAGCAPVPPVPSSDGCGATEYSAALGQDAGSLVLPTDRPARVVPPDAMITMDYRADRVNFETDAFGVVTAITCG